MGELDLAARHQPETSRRIQKRINITKRCTEGCLSLVYGSVQCTEVYSRCTQRCTDGVRRVVHRCLLRGVRTVYGRCSIGVPRWCTDGVRQVWCTTGWCTDGVRQVYGRWCTAVVRRPLRLVLYLLVSSPGLRLVLPGCMPLTHGPTGPWVSWHTLPDNNPSATGSDGGPGTVPWTTCVPTVPYGTVYTGHASVRTLRYFMYNTGHASVRTLRYLCIYTGHASVRTLRYYIYQATPPYVPYGTYIIYNQATPPYVPYGTLYITRYR